MPLAEGRLLCSACNVNSIPAPEGATPETKYICLACSPEIGPEDRAKSLAFDRFQFSGKTDSAFRSQMKPRKFAPPWVFNDGFVIGLCCGFSRGKHDVTRRVRCLYLYFRCSMDHEEISERLGITQGAVKQTIQRLVESAERCTSRSLQKLLEEPDAKR